MPHRHGRKRRHDGQRIRTSSQSSIEIQVSESESVSFITTSANATVTTTLANSVSDLPVPALVQVQSSFLHLIKSVGAEGLSTPYGELFTLKQLYSNLCEYIKAQKLYDPCDPSTVYCHHDPLGAVLGVRQFTRHDALNLIKQQIAPAVSSLIDRSSHNNHIHEWLHQSSEPEVVPCVTIGKGKGRVRKKSSSKPPSAAAGHSSDTQPLLDPDSTVLTPILKTPVGACPAGACEEVTESEDEHNDQAAMATSFCSDKLKSKISQSPQENPPSPPVENKTNLPGGSGLSRERLRQSSISIVLSDTEGPKGTHWQLSFDIQSDSDETVLSVQSKETVFVKDSSDDLWFLEGEDIDGDYDMVSVEIQSAHSNHYQEEYEVESNLSVSVTHLSEHSDSESPDEEIHFLVDEDKDFWADSESSDTDDSSSDEELSPQDKWPCDDCNTLNNPVQRFCSRCWKLRSGWLPPHVPHRPDRNQHRPRRPSPRKPSAQSVASQETLPAADEYKPLDCLNLLPTHNSCDSMLNDHRGDVFLDLHRESRDKIISKLHFDEDKPATLSHQETFVLPSASKTFEYNHELSTTKQWPSRLREDSGIGSSSFGQSSQESGTWSSCLAEPSPTVDTPVTKAQSSAFLSPLKSPMASSSKGIISPQKLTLPKAIDSAAVAAAAAMSEGHRQRPRKPAPLTSLAAISTFTRTVPQSPKTPIKRAPGGREYSDVCMICYSKPKEASIIHGKTGHQVCCYKCAKQLRRRRQPCPLCRRPIQKVIKNYLL